MGWKNCCCISVIVLLCILPASQADNSSSSIFNFIVDNCPMSVTNVDEIKYNQKEWNPDKDWQKKGYTKAWVDIVGYNGMVKYNGTFYINRPHTDVMEIQYGTGHNLPGKKKFDSLTSSITNQSYNGYNAHSVLSTTLKYHWTERDCHYNLEGKKKCKDILKKATEYRDFGNTDTNPPKMYPVVDLPDNIIAMVYNDSIKPKTIVKLYPVNYTLGYRLELNHKSVEYYYNIIQIERLENNFPYGNITPFKYNSIYEDSDIFTRGGNNIIINMSDMNEINNSLKIYIITPYEEQQINFSVVNGTETFDIENATLSNVFSLFILGWIVVFLIKYFRH